HGVARHPGYETPRRNPPPFKQSRYLHTHPAKMANREAAFQAAISDLNVGVFRSQRAAEKAYNTPLATLSRRVRGSQNWQNSHIHQQRLTPQ
ncbi:hypothetical protein DPSP01_014414, partial [Paraphaeosphaeria sporulosa]